MEITMQQHEEMVGKNITFKNGFSAIFCGTVTAAFIDQRNGIKHYQIKDSKRLKKSELPSHGMDINSFDEGRTLLASHIISIFSQTGSVQN